jgi:uroporphyrinogen-III decarboxylase
MKEFEEFVYDIDKPICDLIHNAGCHIWMHCHGRVGKLLERFMDMGIDVLNPIEPPPLGDVTLKQAVKIIGKGMGLEGNIEIQTLLMDSREVVREKIHTAAEEGKLSGRFILCPSAGYMEYVNPTPEYIDNLMLYINYGLECLE